MRVYRVQIKCEKTSQCVRVGSQNQPLNDFRSPVISAYWGAGKPSCTCQHVEHSFFCHLKHNFYCSCRRTEDSRISSSFPFLRLSVTESAVYQQPAERYLATEMRCLGAARGIATVWDQDNAGSEFLCVFVSSLRLDGNVVSIRGCICMELGVCCQTRPAICKDCCK
ncbi:hypothetical protein BaRGS_00020956 [Batillaria attramentaria]|uniref:Uncharacterized protein n=1 Tax=Batillaria attramentaria TaxID=370345 RepID=A0ABD0KKU8_9CAEN